MKRMKRTILILILLTGVVTLPPLYSRWSESRRLKQIRTLKQQARTVLGSRLETVVSALENRHPPAMILLYTGGTRSHLEPCGCYHEQSGGLPRRAYVVERIRHLGFPTFLVDAGDIFDGEAEIDARRCETHTKALSEMAYTAVALSASDLAYGGAYLNRQRAVATFPFLAPETTQGGSTEPFVIKTFGEYSIGFVAGPASRTARSQADILVALGHPESTEDIDIVIRPDPIETVVSDGTIYVGCKPEGKTLGVLALWLDARGEFAAHIVAELALTGDVGESTLIRALLTDFYRSVAESDRTAGRVLFANQGLEQQPGNGYVSAASCRRCHEQEYLQWSATRHAFAYETLLKKDRYFDAGCVACHTTGFGYPTGFQIGDPVAGLNGVQCETCHGPGKRHVGNPKKGNIRRGGDTSLCLACHDASHSLGFTDVVALHLKDVDHSHQPMNLEALLTARLARLGKPTVELFAMSYCPYAVAAEAKLIPILKAFGDAIDFRLYFIASEKETPLASDITPFTSLRGYPEIAENIRQLLIAKEYPDRYLDYILCRGKALDKSWERCAKKLGIDVDRIQELFDAPASTALFRENIQRAAALGIKASPTILVDNHKFETRQLLRARGTPCE